MHIVQVAYEATAFDVHLTRGGTATMVWDLARHYTAAGHRVSIVTPAHGNVDYLHEHHGAEEVGSADVHVVPAVLDPAIWSAHESELPLPVETRTYLVRRDGIDLYFLSDAYADLLRDILYPTNEMQGVDLAFLKPLVFQVDALRFIDRRFAGERAVVQCYEPAYHYLLPPVLAARPGLTTVSTVVVNTRIDDEVYRPQLERVFESFGVDIDLDPFVERELHDPLSLAMRDYFRPSYLAQDRGPDYVCYFGMVAACSDLVDFVSSGQRTYYSTFRDTPFEGRFERLGVSRVVRETAHKHFVGGCALPDWWVERNPAQVDRAALLEGLGLHPGRPTFYHAARLAQNHKGQLELFRAIDAVLESDREINFIVRCAVASAGAAAPIGVPFFQEVADRYPGNVFLDWAMVDEDVLFEQASAADFCLFPSKFELDGFLITMAEAMASGAVPIATAQETLSHYRHTLDAADPAATGFAVPRSFRSDDPLLAERLAERIVEAVAVYRDDPATYERLSRTGTALARGFTWARSAGERLAWFAQAELREPFDYPNELAIEWGWFEQLDSEAWDHHRDQIVATALERGDVDAYRRCCDVDREAAAGLFDAAYARADFEACDRLVTLVDAARRRRLRERCRIVATGTRRVVAYALPNAERVDLIVPEACSNGVGSGNRYTRPLARDGAAFTTTLPVELSDADLVFLVTLESGRVAWDRVRARQRQPVA